LEVPFKEFSVSDQRRGLAHRVLEEGVSVTEAAEEFGVSRQTAHLWVSRARELGNLARLEALSRRPHRIPRHCPPQALGQVLDIARKRPAWGGRKIHAALWSEQEAPICSRTVDRILARHLPKERKPAFGAAIQRFEREACNELWQADFKGLGINPPAFRVLSVLDDHSRFVVALSVVPQATNEEVFQALWDIFGRCGLPEALLTDNEGCFHTTGVKGPSFLEARLWRLGIQTPHGRPGHPQTQGKVERFHRTMQHELGERLKERDPVRIQRILDDYRNDYNWNRPHESLAQRKPGALYIPPLTPRPQTLPEPQHPPQAEIRKVGSNGRFKRKGDFYYLGRGLAADTVAIVDTPQGLAVTYAGHTFALLEELKEL
jgi:transposase InsO family protein